MIVDLPDPNLKEPRGPRILNYLLATHGRRRRPPRRDGRVLLECLETWIGFEGEDLLFTDSTTGRTFWKYSEAVREAEAAQARAKARADEEKARADEEKARADKAEADAREERALAEELKERIRQLEERILASPKAPRSGPSTNGAPHPDL